MSRALLDVNVLLALLDADHVDHERAWAWGDDDLEAGWASCPITENGFIRIISQPRYPSPVSPARAVDLLREARSESNHVFWPCDRSALDGDFISPSRIHGPRQLTDAYLLGLAAGHDGRFVTFDQRVSLDSVPEAAARHLVVL